jgi:beta-lactamase superfamily II metal-dependent hydrolase
MLFSLEALKAEHGDCLLLHWGSAAAPRRLLVDGGPPGVYQETLRPRLMQLRERGPVGRSGRLALDAVVVSHAHPDHIVGVLQLFRELRRAREQGRNARFRVKRLWHNSWPALVAADVGAEEISAVAGEASPTVAAVLRSVVRSNELADAARALGLRENRAFGGDVIQAGEVAELARGLSVTVIGPSAQQLAELREKWRERRATHDPSALAEFLDKAVLNLASIVLVATRGRKRMLLAGDARGDHILRGLEDAGVIGGAAAHFHLLKVPHHGSDRNVTVDFFRRLPADHYVVSGNGKHGNPETETLRMLAAARGAAPYTVHFTYRDGEHELGRRIRAWRAAEQAAGHPVKTAFPTRRTRSLLVELGDEKLRA